LSDNLERIAHQNEVIISLLGRMAFTPEQIREIVTFNKRENLKQKYIEGFNSLDGKKSVSEIANVIGVSIGTLSPILSEWEELGIIYQVSRTRRKCYKRVFPI
jgi:DNA-binding MarR family transcriptional regulator